MTVSKLALGHEATLGEVIIALDGVIALQAERDKRIEQAIDALRAETHAHFTESDKAIQKAEDAQKGVNERGNEFRQQLKDQNETMIPRAEAEQAATALGERIDRAFSTLTTTVKEGDERDTKARDVLRADISELRTLLAASEARVAQQTMGKTDNRGLISLVISAAAIGLTVLTLFLSGGLARPAVAPVAAPPSVIYQTPGGGGGSSTTEMKSTTRPQ